MNPEDNVQKKYDDPADVMLLLAKEPDDVIARAGKSARQEAEEETGKMLLQYEQRARQIVLKIREEARARADEMAARFRDALILRIEEASTAALDETNILDIPSRGPQHYAVETPRAKLDQYHVETEHKPRDSEIEMSGKKK